MRFIHVLAKDLLHASTHDLAKFLLLHSDGWCNAKDICNNCGLQYTKDCPQVIEIQEKKKSGAWELYA
jgi:hypothetical protein